jgi:hypothetical protein
MGVAIVGEQPTPDRAVKVVGTTACRESRHRDLRWDHQRHGQGDRPRKPAFESSGLAAGARKAVEENAAGMAREVLDHDLECEVIIHESTIAYVVLDGSAEKRVTVDLLAECVTQRNV